MAIFSTTLSCINWYAVARESTSISSISLLETLYRPSTYIYEYYRSYGDVFIISGCIWFRSYPNTFTITIILNSKPIKNYSLRRNYKLLTKKVMKTFVLFTTNDANHLELKFIQWYCITVKNGFRAEACCFFRD